MVYMRILQRSVDFSLFAILSPSVPAGMRRTEKRFAIPSRSVHQTFLRRICSGDRLDFALRDRGAGSGSVEITCIEVAGDYAKAEKPAVILLIVLCETVWVLSRAYGYSRKQIVIVLRQILLTDCFDIEEYAQAWDALYDY